KWVEWIFGLFINQNMRELSLRLGNKNLVVPVQVNLNQLSALARLSSKLSKDRKIFAVVSSQYDFDMAKLWLGKNPALSQQIVFVLSSDPFINQNETVFISEISLESVLNSIMRTQNISKEMLALGFFPQFQVLKTPSVSPNLSLIYGMDLFPLFDSLLSAPLELQNWERIRSLAQVLSSHA
ncbi:MAG: hypothetical protein ACKVQC_08335, partial [Elusimicrobiota bacterium]